MQTHFSRPEIDASGRAVDVPLGPLPTGQDFANTAKRVVGSAPMSAQEKLLRLYSEQGVHPSEVAADAAQDPLVTQSLASAATDLPERYQSAQPAPAGTGAAETPPAVAAPPEPEVAPTGLETGGAIQSLPSDTPNQIQSFRPGDLTVDADRFQFKSGGDEAGVTDRLQGVQNWDPVKAGLSLVWEDNSGKPFIVDGHQRYGLAQRIAQADPAQDPKLNAIVVREADGISDTEARVIAASKNIAEGTGTALDAAKVLRDQPDLVEDCRRVASWYVRRAVLPTSMMSRSALSSTKSCRRIMARSSVGWHPKTQRCKAH